MTDYPELVKTLEQGGFRHPKELVQVLLGGSHQHGARLEDGGDLDIYGIYIEEPVSALGVSQETHFTGGTADQYEKNQDGDEDYKCYTLKRWAGLACKGNPTILGFLFSPPAPYKDLGRTQPTVWETMIKKNQELFMAKGHANAFFGFAQSQVMRLKGLKGRGKKGQRPELETKFGYDVKAAMHLMRMMYECEEFLLTGHITYPRPEKDILLDIRQGKWTLEELFTAHYELEQRVRSAEEKSTLPEKVDRQKVSELITDCYLTHWSQRGQLRRYLGF